jgi:iron(III) transport system permease protein
MLKRFGLWSFIATCLALIILSPLLIIFLELLTPAGGNWQHVAAYLLRRYLTNTLLLIAGVVAITSVFGIATAWLVTQYRFAGSQWLDRLLMMPLAIPTYIMAYAYSGIFKMLERHHIVSLDIRNMTGLIFILSFALYPYMYAVCKTSFLLQNASLLEASRVLGKNRSTTFLRVALPLSRIAVAGGISLVVMELLNDYGAVKYYGVDTVTVGIFRTWFSMGDLNTAVRICAIALAFVVMLILAEKIQRGRKILSESASTARKTIPASLEGISSFTAFLVCAVPVLLAFVFPLMQIIYWSALSYRESLNTDFIRYAFNTLLLAAIATLLCTVTAIIFNFSKNWEFSRLVKIMSRLATTGYAIPGAVIAIGVLIPALYIDRYLAPDYSILNNSVIFLLFAYVVRFIALPNNTLEANFKKISPQIISASRVLGKGSLTTLFKVQLPLLKPGIMYALLLVFVEVIKELPLTLILRPFDFSTLATRCFQMANDERIAESGIYALIIVAAGMLPVFLLNQLLKANDT